MSFDQAFALTVSPAIEGGYSCNAADPGNWTGGAVGQGELLGTQYGISAAWLASAPGTPSRNPRDLSLPMVREIYVEWFWKPAAADKATSPVAGLLFDAAVNQGPGWAPRCLQGALGVAQDGVIGPKTLDALRSADTATLHAEIARLRDARYRSDPEWPVFGVGWTRRLMRVVAATWAFS